VCVCVCVRACVATCVCVCVRARARPWHFIASHIPARRLGHNGLARNVHHRPERPRRCARQGDCGALEQRLGARTGIVEIGDGVPGARPEDSDPRGCRHAASARDGRAYACQEALVACHGGAGTGLHELGVRRGDRPREEEGERRESCRKRAPRRPPGCALSRACARTVRCARRACACACCPAAACAAHGGTCALRVHQGQGGTGRGRSSAWIARTLRRRASRARHFLACS